LKGDKNVITLKTANPDCVQARFAAYSSCHHQSRQRLGSETGSPLLVQCEINGRQKFPLNEPEINFSFFIFEPSVAYFQKPFWCYRPKMQYVYVCSNDT